MRAGQTLLRRLAWSAVVAIAALGAVVPLAIGQNVTAATLAVPATGSFVPGEAIVRFDPATTPVDRREARSRAKVEYDSALALPRTQVVSFEGSVLAAVRRLEAQSGVAYAQPNYRYEATAVEPPNDTLFSQLWGLSDPALPDPGVSTLEAWEVTEGAGQTIAVVDTGVDLTHPDLEPNLWTNAAELGGTAGLDDDLNGRVDDVHGFDFVDADGDPDDYNFHGTHVAGTAAAVADNDAGTAGVAPAAEIMAVRVLDGDGGGSTDEIADGIAYAAENGADVINLSLGGPAGEDEAMEDAVELAGAEDAVVVAAAGNEGVNNDTDSHTPCALPQANLICVAALTQSGILAGFSNFGVKSVDIAAPGTNVLSAKTDWGPSLFSDNFDSGLGSWTTQTFNGGLPWGTSETVAVGTKAATDSPVGNYGQAIVPTQFAVSELFSDAKVNLIGERGCRIHFRALYQTESFFDFFLAGALDEATGDDFAVFTGTSPGYGAKAFEREEASISDLAGRNDVHPFFALLSDETIQGDGAYVDEVRLICRDESYVDAEVSVALYDLPDVGSYVRFQGTSMATPHVSGVVALVRAAAPSAGTAKVIDAVLSGASAIPSPSASRRTATEGIADACQAIAVVTGGDFTTECPGSSENVIPRPFSPPDGSGEAAPPAASPPPTVSDTRRPRTFFREHPPKVVRTPARRAKVIFRFDADEEGVSFLCRIDGGFLRPCQARLARRFAVGFHMVRVMARDAAGNVDATPAVYRFRVKLRG